MSGAITIAEGCTRRARAPALAVRPLGDGRAPRAVQPPAARLPDARLEVTRRGCDHPERYGDELYAALRARAHGRAAHRARARASPSTTPITSRAACSSAGSADGERVIGKKIGVTSKAVQTHARRAPAGLRLPHRSRCGTRDGAEMPIGARADPAARRGRDRVRAEARPGGPRRHARRRARRRPSA